MLDLAFKLRVHAACENQVNEKLNLLSTELHEALEAGNNETKSTAGDKHETGRAMAQLEQENLRKQIGQLQEVMATLEQLKQNQLFDTALAGAMIETETMLLYLGAPIGSISIDNKQVFAISLASPLGQLIFKKKAGEVFSFNNFKSTIKAIV